MDCSPSPPLTHKSQLLHRPARLARRLKQKSAAAAPSGARPAGRSGSAPAAERLPLRRRQRPRRHRRVRGRRRPRQARGAAGGGGRTRAGDAAAARGGGLGHGAEAETRGGRGGGGAGLLGEVARRLARLRRRPLDEGGLPALAAARRGRQRAEEAARGWGRTRAGIGAKIGARAGPRVRTKQNDDVPTS